MSKYPNYQKNKKSYFGCKHWRERVQVGRKWVTCSSLGDGKRLDPKPDFGIYMCSTWRQDLSPFWTDGAYVKRVAAIRQYPALVVDWPDMGSLKPELLDQLVEICLSKMRQGKWIDIGCNAGHGRTGSLLACLIARKEHLTGEQAIAEVRRRYCQHAIETKLQENAVREYIDGRRERLI
jgi:hypothetical protein